MSRTLNSSMAVSTVKMLLNNRRYRLWRFVTLQFPPEMIISQRELVDEAIDELRSRGVSEQDIQST